MFSNNISNSTPRIVFVDGSTGVGKDYFINDLSKLLEEKSPNITFEIIKANSVVINHRTKRKNRQYINYNTDDNKITDLFAGHINLLCYINEVLNSTKKDTDVVVIDRSFLSFLIFNIYSKINDINKDFYSLFLDTYSRLFSNLFYNTPSLFIHLDLVPEEGMSKYDTILYRIQNRHEGKYIDKRWINELLSKYDKVDEKFLDMFAFVERVDSSSSSYIFNKYFT